MTTLLAKSLFSVEFCKIKIIPISQVNNNVLTEYNSAQAFAKIDNGDHYHDTCIQYALNNSDDNSFYSTVPVYDRGADAIDVDIHNYNKGYPFLYLDCI